MSTDGCQDDDVPVFRRVVEDGVEDHAEDLGRQTGNGYPLSETREDGSNNRRTCGAIDRHAQLGQLPLDFFAENLLELSPSALFASESSGDVHVCWVARNRRGAVRASRKWQMRVRRLHGIKKRTTNHSEESTKKVMRRMSRRIRSISPDVEEPAVLRALYVRVRDVREVEAWSRNGSNQVSSGHVEPSDSDMYDMEEEEEHEMDVLPGWPSLAVAKPCSRRASLCLPTNFPTSTRVELLWRGWIAGFYQTT